MRLLHLSKGLIDAAPLRPPLAPCHGALERVPVMGASKDSEFCRGAKSNAIRRVRCDFICSAIAMTKTVCFLGMSEDNKSKLKKALPNCRMLFLPLGK